MKIVYLIEWMYNSAGMERVTANKVNYWADYGHDVLLVTTDQQGRPDYYPLRPSVRRIDLAVNFEAYQGLPIARRVLAYLKKSSELKKKLRELLMKERPDVCVSLMLKSACVLYRIKDGSRKVIEHHFSHQYAQQFSDTFNRHGLNRFIYALSGRVEAHYIKKYEHFVVLTEEDKRLWGSRFKNICVIPNSLSFMPQSKAALQNKVVLAIGRLDYQKGFDLLLDVWNSLQPTPWQLHIYGDGPLKSDLENKIRTLHLQNVSLYPPTHEIQDVMLESSVFVLSSRFEGFPMALIEALACGLPAVSTDCPCGPGEIIRDGRDGYVVPLNDLKAFANRLKALMTDDVLRRQLGSAAACSVQRFSEAEVMLRWERLFGIS
ncbi:MAG: glycosyltransferase family 4 protein [Paludibacteraceae bacterium]|nr:glycosyltransferase family 4 protein [Paludibacteraceae bacterium]